MGPRARDRGRSRAVRSVGARFGARLRTMGRDATRHSTWWGMHRTCQDQGHGAAAPSGRRVAIQDWLSRRCGRSATCDTRRGTAGVGRNMRPTPARRHAFATRRGRRRPTRPVSSSAYCRSVALRGAMRTGRTRPAPLTLPARVPWPPGVGHADGSREDASRRWGPPLSSWRKPWRASMVKDQLQVVRWLRQGEPGRRVDEVAQDGRVARAVDHQQAVAVLHDPHEVGEDAQVAVVPC